MLRRIFAALLIWLGLVAGAAAQPARQVDAELHSARAAVAPGERFTIVLRQSIREGWHTYWRNPGDSGLPTRLEWDAPPGVDIGPLQWPAPEALPFAGLVNHGYTGEVLFPIDVRAPRNARAGETLTLSAHARWLVCSDICIPEDAVLTFEVPVSAQGRDDPNWAGHIAHAVAELPKREPGVDARITAGAPARLSVTFPGAGNIRNIRFFAYSPDAVRAAAAQHPRIGASGASFMLTPGVADDLGQAPLAGVIAYEVQERGAWVRRGVEIEAQPGEAIAGTDARAAPMSEDYPLAELEETMPDAGPSLAAPGGMALAIALAFLGGLILNIMPCVLPVLSVKALAFAGGAQAGEARRHGLFYFAGVMATFLLLAALLIALRGAGEVVGWGFQLQQPWVNGGLALLFFAIGLNLLGVFSIGGPMQNAGSGLAAMQGETGAFFTGALAVIAATPCTAPFMAGAIGAALMQSSATAWAIFAALGFGFALPLTALHFAPGLQRLMPKPGPWMERAKQVLAFPMFAAAIWLAWVLTQQAGANGLLALLSLAAALAFVLFVARWGRAWLVAGVLALTATAAFAWRPFVGAETVEVLSSEPWSPARVAELRAEGRPVFINFTAAWCVTCKVNEAVSLTTPRVARAFAAHNVAYLVADWTNEDETIGAELAAHGRAGVPLYLYYPADGGDPVVLPQILSERLMLETVGEAAE